MPSDNFLQQKQDILSKQDKSSKQSLDKKIRDLCNKINKLENYYTTSSCSGRIILIIESNKKEHGLFVKIYHDLLNFEGFKRDLKKICDNTSKPQKLDAPFCSHINKQLTKNPEINNDLAEKSDKVDFGATKSRAKQGELISFKQEPCGIHVACRTLRDSQNFLDKAKFAGWKKSGIIASNKRFVVECFSTETL